MRLVCIYGAPGVGKLTVGNELAKMTDYRLLHNHLTADLVESLFERDDPRYPKLLGKIRIQLIDEAAKAKLDGLIMTLALSKSNAKSSKFEPLLKKFKKQGGIKFCFVHLVCDKAALFKRVSAKSRKSYGKITNINALKKKLVNHDYDSEISFLNALRIDNTALSAKKCASQIKDYYHL